MSPAARIGLATVAVAACLAIVPRTAQAGAWTLEEGTLWGKTALLFLSSDTVFADENDVFLTGCASRIEPGDRRPYDCETLGTFSVAAVYFEVVAGIRDDLDVGLQVPVILHTSFTNESGLAGQDGGLGDLRLTVRYRLVARPVVLSLAAEVKAPTGNFSVDEAVPPLGEGQWDTGLRAQLGWSTPRVYLGADLGYRLRFENPETGIDVGDEIVALAEAGLNAFPWLTLPVKASLLYGFDSEEQGAPVERPGRWILSVTPGVLFRVHERVAIELSVRVPIAGEGYPADPTWGVAVMGTTPPLWGEDA